MAKHEAKEAHIELDEYEAELRRKGRFQRKQAEEADKWSQIAQGIAANNAMHSTDDPEYWEPDAWELTQLHGMWKLDPKARCEMYAIVGVFGCSNGA